MAENKDGRGRFLPGKSGNPGGRPKGTGQFSEAMRARSPEALKAVDDALASEDLSHRRWAATMILNYAWGKPSPMMTDEEPEPEAPRADTVELAKRIVWVLAQAATDQNG